jgi:hypothetical protein
VTVVAGETKTQDIDLRTVVREWCLASDFSQRDNPNGAWSYGYLDAIGGAFNPYEEFTWSGAYPGQFGFWKPRGGGAHDRLGSVDIHVGSDDSALYDLQCYDRNQVSLHAGRGRAADGSDNVSTTARWTSPLDGRVSVNAVFEGLAYGKTGTHAIVGVTVNSESKFSTRIDGFVGGCGVDSMGPNPTESYTGILPVSVGDTIDFTGLFKGEGLVEGYVGCGVTIKEVADPPQRNDK